MRQIVYMKAKNFDLITPNYWVAPQTKENIIRHSHILTEALMRAPIKTPVKTPVKTSVKTKKKAIPKHVKTLVWDKYIGSDKAEAACCCCLSTPISIRNFHCGHVISEVNGGDLTIQNLRPICAPCNLSMGRQNMNDFTKIYFGWSV